MSNDQKEYVVRVPSDTQKQFHVMRFSNALNVDLTKFKNCKMEREVFLKEVPKEYKEEELPEFGAGSEYGRKEKEEARRRKFEKRKHKQNNSPWILTVGGKHGKKYRGIREGGVTENASYYVFFQASDGMFEAFPVNEWYNFTPFQRYKVLTAEQAEEKFNSRNQILNFFQLKNSSKNKDESDKNESSSKSDRKIKKEFKVTDMDDWDDMSENEAFSGDDSDGENKFKPKKGKKDKRKIKKEEDSDEEEPMEDSDEGDQDDKEVDYMSDESSSSESEEEKVDLKGVEDESALRGLVVSEDDEEEENKEENNEQNEDQSKTDADKNLKPEKTEKKGNDSLSESDFDSDNSDLEESKLALLMQKSQPKTLKTKQETTPDSKTNEQSKRKLDHDTPSSNAANNNKDNSDDKSNGLKFKHKLENALTNDHISKKLKIRHDTGVTEEAVRRYLIRKPMTAADLVSKFKNKAVNKRALPDALAMLLKKINPDKQNIKGKMYFSLQPT